MNNEINELIFMASVVIGFGVLDSLHLPGYRD